MHENFAVQCRQNKIKKEHDTLLMSTRNVGWTGPQDKTNEIRALAYSPLIINILPTQQNKRSSARNGFYTVKANLNVWY